MGIGKIFGFLASNSKQGRTESNLNRKLEQDVRRIDMDKEKQRLIKHEKNRKEKIAEINEKIAAASGPELKLSFSYETTNQESIDKIQAKMTEKGYTGFDIAEADGTFVMIGTANGIKADKPILREWVKTMCNLGHQNRCVLIDWNLVE